MKLTNVNLDRLKFIAALSMTGSFSRAAEILNLTPSAVNQGLTTLEAQLGMKLFIRRGKTIVPTAACNKIQSLYQPFATELESILEAESSSQKNISGRLKVFIPTLVGPLLLAKPFLKFLEKFPQVSLSLDNGPASQALDEVYKNNFDLGICGLQILIKQNKWCFSRKLTHLTMGLYCSPDFFVKNKKLILAKKFESLLFMTGVNSQYMLDWYFKDILKCKFKSPSRFSMYDMSFTVQAIAKGFGIGLLAEELVKKEIDQGQIINIGTKPLIHPLFFIYHKDKKLSLLEQTFIEEVSFHFDH